MQQPKQATLLPNPKVLTAFVSAAPVCDKHTPARSAICCTSEMQCRPLLVSSAQQGCRPSQLRTLQQLLHYHQAHHTWHPEAKHVPHSQCLYR